MEAAHLLKDPHSPFQGRLAYLLPRISLFSTSLKDCPGFPDSALFLTYPSDFLRVLVPMALVLIIIMDLEVSLGLGGQNKKE